MGLTYKELFVEIMEPNKISSAYKDNTCKEKQYKLLNLNSLLFHLLFHFLSTL